MVELTLVERKPPAGSAGAAQRPALGVIETVSAGFEVVLRRPWVLSIPIMLDLFLWLGPRASAPALYRQFDPVLQQMIGDARSTDSRFAVLELSKVLQNFFAQFNLVSWLSSGWLGVPVVNGGLDATAPVVMSGLPLNASITNFDTYFLLTIACGIAGLFLSGLYWAMLAGSVRAEGIQPTRWIRAGYHIWLQLLLLVLILIGLALMAILPLTMAMTIVSVFSIGLASLIPALALVAVLWLFFYGVFTLPGLALYRLSVGRALRISALLVRLNFMPVLMLLVTVLAIYLGMGLIWDSIPSDSWLRLLAIAGHAVTSTGVVLASILFYQNRSLILFERFHWPLPDQASTVNR